MPTAEMAAAAVKAAIDEDEDGEAPMVQIIAPTIVVRDSSGPAPVSPARSTPPDQA
jgi:DNA-binding LacI/PurR family transcriptional regulator